jgi:hypothetical protein
VLLQKANRNLTYSISLGLGLAGIAKRLQVLKRDLRHVGEALPAKKLYEMVEQRLPTRYGFFGPVRARRNP